MTKPIVVFTVSTVVCLALAYVALETWAESRRPIFFNERAQIGPFWLPSMPSFDEEGATIWFDRRLNLLVVLQRADPEDAPLFRTASPDRVIWPDGRELRRTRDAVVLIAEDDEREIYELDSDQAGRLKEEVLEEPSFADAIRAKMERSE